VTVIDRVPHLSDDSFIQNGVFRDVNIGAIPVNRRTFFEKYYLTVDQIRLNKDAYEFFRLINAQKEGAASLFQPASGKIRSNIHRIDTEEDVLGFFWAGGIRTKARFIEKSEVPYRVGPIETMAMECYKFGNAVATKPPFWE
jgi:hypothetical protein